MNNVVMAVIVPYKYAVKFEKEGRISDFNNLPQINHRALKVIRDFVIDNVGYDDLPIASLKCANVGSVAGVDFRNYLDEVSKNSVLYQLEIPEDMVVSVDFDTLLKHSRNLESLQDDILLELEEDSLESDLIVGTGDSRNMISFIPFLDYSKCKFYATLQGGYEDRQEIHLKTMESFGN